MIAWYSDMIKKRMTVSFLIVWVMFAIITLKYDRLLFFTLYIPVIYPLLIVIFLSIYIHHPHLIFLYEIQKKHATIFFKQMLWTTYHALMLMTLFMLCHVLILMSYRMTFDFNAFMMLHSSTLFIYGLFNPLTTKIFYKITGFLIMFISHHFLLDLPSYHNISFLFLTHPSMHQNLILIVSFLLFQWLHFLSIKKKVL